MKEKASGRAQSRDSTSTSRVVSSSSPGPSADDGAEKDEGDRGTARDKAGSVLVGRIGLRSGSAQGGNSGSAAADLAADAEIATEDDDRLSSLGSVDGDLLPTLDGIHVANAEERKAVKAAATQQLDEQKKRAEEARQDDDEKRTADSIGQFFGIQQEDRLVARAAYDSLLARLHQLEAHLAAATREARLEQDRFRESEDKCAELSQALKLAGDTLKMEVDQQRELQRKLQQREDELLLREKTVEVLEQRMRSCGIPTAGPLPVAALPYKDTATTVGSLATATRNARNAPQTTSTASQPSRLPRLVNHPSYYSHPLPPDLTARGGGRLTSLGFV
ncbi:hypothetical protein DIPPA_22934 [Diplonema papillatum]|nr:hypothetical protein DIPPA_22934 [Diplonema papillatum]|eukprot:gene19657-30291_t